MDTFSPTEAKHIGDAIGVDWTAVDLEQFRMGLSVDVGDHEICRVLITNFT